MGLILEPVSKGKKIPIDKAVIFFGRHPDCDVVLTRSRKVSRKHCCIAQVDDRLVIRDLGSMNGVKINGERIKKVKDLSLGDEISIGDVKYCLKVDSIAGNSAKKRPAKKPKPSRKPVQKKKKKPKKDLNLSMDFPVPLNEEEDEDNSLLETDKIEEENTPSSLPLAGLNQIEDDDEYDELGAVDIIEDDDEDDGMYDFEMDDDDEDDSDEDIILLDD